MVAVVHLDVHALRFRTPVPEFVQLSYGWSFCREISGGLSFPGHLFVVRVGFHVSCHPAVTYALSYTPGGIGVHYGAFGCHGLSFVPWIYKGKIENSQEISEYHYLYFCLPGCF